MLEIVSLTAGYRRTDVLHDVSLSVPAGTVVGLLGPNGAGKTTLVKSISHLTRVRSGRIIFDGRSIARLPPEAIVEAGIIHVPQGRMLFPELSVEDNLRLGAYSRRARSTYRVSRDRVEAHFPILKERRRQTAGVLSGGEQQMLALGRALMAAPRLLILDEPSLGLAPRIVEDIFRVIRLINAEGVTVLIAEQNARKVLQTAATVYVLENGTVAHSGPSAQLLRSEKIRRTYLGIG